ncbi:PAS domain S-box protein [Noviherbaspirillum aerium]|uniref:PAS domain S-box protein n=1 Tax=Noviherbaspirillum aerium TaxID=2588497 RepID=UPI00124C20D5|nr:PAS domain S-box protein [Noviherbaspirillum aerium]
MEHQDSSKAGRTLAAFRNTGDYAYILMDVAGVITDWNPAARELLGWAEDEAIGQRIDIIFAREDIASGSPEKERALALKHGVAADERWHVRRDGSSFWAIGQITAIFERHEHIGFAKILRDRTRERMTEERLRIAQHAGGLGTFEYYPDSGVVSTSQQFCRLWNLPEQDQYSISYLAQFLHPEDREPFFSLRDEAAECRLLRPKDGSFRWIARRGQALKSDAKHPPRFAGVCYDIHDLKQSEYELREMNSRLQSRETRFRQLAEFAPGVTWLSDPGGNLTYLNSQWHKYSGQTIEQALQDGWATALHPQDKSSVLTAWNDALQRGNHYEVEARFRRKDGVYRWYLIRAESFFNPDGSVAGWFGSSVDIHERMLAEATLRLKEKRQNILLSFDESIRGHTAPATIKQACCQFLVDCLDVELAGYGDVDQEDGSALLDVWLRNAQALRQGKVSAELLVPNGLAGLSRGRTYTLERHSPSLDAMASEDNFLTALARAPARVVVPFVENDIVHSLLFVGDVHRSWETDDIALIEELARKTCMALQKAIAARELERRVEALAMERDQIWRMTPDLLVVLDMQGHVLNANPAVTSILGWSTEEFIQRELNELVHPDDLARTYEEIGRHSEPGYRTQMFQIRCVHKSGGYRWLSWTASSEQQRVFANARDITDLKAQTEALQHAEEVIRQSQKMEAVGRLTGGIAHDFNNHLQGIRGSLELIRHFMQVGRTGVIERYVELATTATEKAAALTQRLLAFSRRQPLSPQPIDVNRLVSSLEDLLQRTMGNSIQVIVAEDAEKCMALADGNQLENAILNLAINARDAMPHGGTLHIKTRKLSFDAAHPSPHSFIAPGKYVVTSVTDDGTGMSDEVLAHVFEPFFTTKPMGQGTGLGLSMVYGFAKQSNGAVTVESEPGIGTTVKLFLPFYDGKRDEEGDEGNKPSFVDAKVEKTIVVIEDDAVVRDVICEALNELNYHVLAGTTGADGLELLDAAGHVDLLITDVVLPDITGIDLVGSVRGVRPNLKVLFMTGYAEFAANKSGFLEEGQELLTKPFTLQDLSLKIQNMLG